MLTPEVQETPGTALDLLAVAKTGDIEIALNDAERAAELRPADQSGFCSRYVVMPMRICWSGVTTVSVKL
jgi:hypothetical protein